MVKVAVKSNGRSLLVQVARGQLPPTAISAAQEREIRDFCRADVDHRSLKIGLDVQRKAFRPARRKADALRASLAGRLHALWLSLPAGLRDRHDIPGTERAERRVRRWIALTESLREVGQLSRPATLSLRAKPKGPPGAAMQRRYRPISVFNWIDEARQRLIGFGLAPFVDFHPSQYMLRWSGRGRGRSAVYKTLLDRLPTLGPDHVFVQLDVRGFYQHISHTWLEENLPLPRDVIRAQVHTGGMMFAPIRNSVTARLGLNRDGALEALARQGMPMGSALATLVGEYVMAEVLRELADRQEAPMPCAHAPDLHTYSDNLGVFVERAQTAAVVDLYRRTFASSAAGPFSLTCSAPASAWGPFKFLGYWFRLRDGNAEAYVPDDIAASKADAITQDILTASPRELARMRERINGAAADWKYWAGVDAWRKEVLAIVLCAEETLSLAEIAEQVQIERLPMERATSSGPGRSRQSSRQYALPSLHLASTGKSFRTVGARSAPARQ